MEDQDKGFLNDTSLSKTPKSPLKTSTVMKPSEKNSSEARLRQKAAGDDSLFSVPPDSTKALNEVTNMSNFVPKPRFNFTMDSSHNESSLGILQMDNFSDFTDTSMQAMIYSKTPQKRKSKSKKSSIQKSLISKTNLQSYKENCSLNPTQNNLQSLKDSEKEYSDSDIEYDGTNIPELNMEYDGLGSLLTKDPVNLFQNHPSESISASLKMASIMESNKNSVCSEEKSNSTNFSISEQAGESGNSRESIFKTCEPPSFLDALLSNKSNRKISESWKMLGLDSSKTEAIFQNESIAEQNFLKSLQKFNVLSDSPLKFCTDEISARSSSFGSPSTSADFSSKCDLQKSEFLKSVNEDLKDEMLNRSTFPETLNKPTKLSSTYTKCESKVLQSKSPCKGIGDDFDCELNYKNTSMFYPESEKSFEEFQISDSEFINPGDALELFQKDEESYMKEHMFEMNNSKECAAAESNYSLPLLSDVTAPSWYLEEFNGSKLFQRISVGTLISARTENLGKLSQDSKRERPYFGIEATTPIRDQDRTLLSETSDTKTPESSYCSSLKSELSQSLKSNNETEILRGSTLSRILNDTSTTNPLDLALKIIDRCQFKDKGSAQVALSEVSPVKHLSLEDIHKESLNSFSKTSTTLARSSSTNNLERTLSESNKEESVNNSLSVSNVELNNRKMEGNAAATRGCVHCSGQAQSVARPPSSCASYAMSVHNSCPSLHGCMSHYGPVQPSAFPMCQFPPHNGCSHGFQHPNPYVQEVLSSFHLQNQQGAYSSMAYNATGAIPVQGPSQLVYPEKIAIGDSQHLNLTVQNCHNRSFFYHVALTSALINNKSVSIEVSGVNVPCIVPSSVGNTTDIQVSLSPRYEGSIVVTVQVVACLNPIQPIPNTLQNTLQTTIHYEALRPVVNIAHESQNSLDIGTTVAGCTVKKQITIQNKSDASVPLYIGLSSDMKNNRIFFELNQMKSQKLADPEWQILSQKDILYRLPSAKHGAVGSTLDVPIIIETGTEDSDVSFVLAASIQSSNQREILDLFRISATVRVAKLDLVDSSQNTLVLQPDSSKKNLRVKNNASIPMIYDLLVVGDETQSFSVSPSSLDLQPMQTTVITVSFTPSCNQVVKGFLQASSQPHRKLFSLVELFGDVQPSSNSKEKPTSKTTSKRPASRSSEVMQCNRKFIFWKGVDVGSSISKTFTVKNDSSTTLPFKLYIKEKSRGFKLLAEENQHTYSISLELASREEKEFAVTFSPTSVVSTCVPLYIKAMEAQQKIFTLPLIGYSGSGHLEVKGLTSRPGIGDCLDVCAQAETKSSLNSVIVQNTGEREMFLRVVVSLGKAFETDGHVHVNPTEFVLLKNETKILFISTSVPDQLVGYNETDWGKITLLYGDEILRQQMRRSRKGKSSLPWNNVVDDVNFDVPFEGEDRVPCDFSIHSTSKLQSFFCSSVKKFLIHLNVARAADISQGSFNALSVIDNTYADITSNSTMMSQRRVTMGTSSHSPPVKDFMSIPLNRQSVPMVHSSELMGYSSVSAFEESNISSNKIPTWIVKPDSLTVEPNSKDNRVLLINTSNQDLRFKIDCEIHVISVSPTSGIIPARGQIGLRISVIAYSVSKLLEDYQGYIKVICDNAEKSILIKVPRFSKKLDIPEANVNAAGKSKSVGASAEKTIISSPVAVQNIYNFPQEISFNEAALGKTSETVITVKNLESVSVMWIIQPLGILFTETMDDTLNSESILEISPSSGTLEPNASTNIAINFSPSSLNKYSRFYKLSLTTSNGIKKTCNFKIEGKSVLGTEASGDLSRSTIIPDRSTQVLDHKFKRESKSSIQVENKICEFPATALGKSSVSFVTVRNYSSQDMQISIKNPEPPFYIKNLEITVRKKKFFQLPIAFKPRLSDPCERTLELHSEDGNKIEVTLIGICK